MEKPQAEKPNQPQIKSKRGPLTPSHAKKNIAGHSTSIRPQSSRQRTTMMPSDINRSFSTKFDLNQSQCLSRRRLASDRASMIPSQVLLDRLTIIDSDSKDIELGLLYDEYTQNTLSSLIMEKKAKEIKELSTAQLATIAIELDHDEEKLFKLKSRERGRTALALAQNEVDRQIAEINKGIKSEQASIVKSTLSHLHSILQPFCALRCKNIILPETPEECKDIRETLKECANTLKPIAAKFEPHSTVYQNVSDAIKDFLEEFKDIEDCAKEFEEELCALQVLALKTASLSLSQCSDE